MAEPMDGHDELPVEVRVANLSDLDAVALLMRGQNRYHADLVPHIIKEATRAGTRSWCADQLADPTQTVLLAETDDDRPVGALMMRCKIYPDRAVMHGVRLGFVDELFVTEDVRRRGVARALITAAKAEARRLDCQALSLNVWGANVAAISAYDALGFETVYQRMTMALD